MRYAVINPEGTVTGVVIWDGETEWSPPENHDVRKLDDDSPVGPRWTFDGTDWIAPPPKPDDDAE